MVKLTGPGTAQAASGSLAGSLTFSHTKRGAYLKRPKKPAQPRTQPQMSMRAMMAWLANQWAAASAPDKATWADLAAQTNISPFNAYQAYNLERWRNWLEPSRAYPAAETGTYPTPGPPTALGGVRSARVHWSITARADGWGINVLRNPAATFTNNWTYLVAVIAMPASGPLTWLDTPLTAGTWYYRFTYSTTAGRVRITSGIRTAVVTN